MAQDKNIRPYLKNNYSKNGMALETKHLATKHETPSSNSNATKKK
jgi:hypothetical protein